MSDCPYLLSDFLAGKLRILRIVGQSAVTPVNPFMDGSAMAQQTTVRFVDDLDGSEAVGTVTFSLDNRAYEIDLSDENTDKLHEALAPFIEHGRKAGGRSGRARPHPGAGGDDRRTRSPQPRGDPRDPRVGSPARSRGERPRAHLEVGDGGVQGRHKLSRWAVVGPVLASAHRCYVTLPGRMSCCDHEEDYVRSQRGDRGECLLEHPGPA